MLPKYDISNELSYDLYGIARDVYNIIACHSQRCVLTSKIPSQAAAKKAERSQIRARCTLYSSDPHLILRSKLSDEPKTSFKLVDDPDLCMSAVLID